MLIREMKSDMCLCNTPVHDTQPINTTELAYDQIKTFEYAGYYADKIVVGSGLIRHLFYYILHIAGFIASGLLIYGNRTSRPRLYLPFIGITAAEIVVAGVESVLFLVAIIGIRAGAYPDIPANPDSIRANVILILFSAIILEIFAIVLSAYFIWVVWRSKEYMEKYEKNPLDNNTFTVSYTNQASDLNSQAGTSTPLPNVPATYRV